MNPIITATAENLDTLTATDKAQVELAAEALTIAGTINAGVTLDHVETGLRVAFPGAFIYRGGSHVALHLGPAKERVLLVTERRPEPELLADEPKYCGKCDSYHRRGPACETFGATTALARNLQACTGAVSEAAQATSRVQAYVDGLGGVERHYAAAYAHWADKVGEDGAIAHAANRGKGLTGSAKQTIRRAINAARAGA